MKITNLHLENMRTIEQASFYFQSDFNLLVGVNGVGKSTILDALTICLSKIISDKTRYKFRANPLGANDIRIGENELVARCRVEHGKDAVTYSLSASMDGNGKGLRRQDRYSYPGRLFTGPAHNGHPLAILFATNRAVPTQARGTFIKGSVHGGGSMVAALNGAFAKRELHLDEISDWVYAREVLGKEYTNASNMLKAFDKVLGDFMPGFSSLHTNKVAGDARHELMIKKDNMEIPVRYLSDGERGVLSIVLDITRRLSLANPESKEPSLSTEAIVLIDEIDLHLHPEWQRKIVGGLLRAFPKCQFIATTHSPQVIGEVKHEQIHIMPLGSEIHSPTHSYGVDSSRVLQEIMGVPSRAHKVDDLLKEIDQLSARDEYELVRHKRDELAALVGEDDPEIVYVDSYLKGWE